MISKILVEIFRIGWNLKCFSRHPERFGRNLGYLVEISNILVVISLISVKIFNISVNISSIFGQIWSKFHITGPQVIFERLERSGMRSMEFEGGSDFTKFAVKKGGTKNGVKMLSKKCYQSSLKIIGFHDINLTEN